MGNNMKEVVIFTAENPAIAQMLVEKLSRLGVPARLGVEAATAGAFGIPEGSRTILVPEEHAHHAKEILEVK